MGNVLWVVLWENLVDTDANKYCSQTILVHYHITVNFNVANERLCLVIMMATGARGIYLCMVLIMRITGYIGILSRWWDYIMRRYIFYTGIYTFRRYLRITPCYTVSICFTPCDTVLKKLTPCYTVLKISTPCNTVAKSWHRVTRCENFLTPCHTVSKLLTPCNTVSKYLTPCHTVSKFLTPCHTVSTF